MNKTELLGVAITIVVVALLVFTFTNRMSQPAESVETIKVAAEAANAERCDKYAANKVIAPTESATSGKLFKGEKIAHFAGERKFTKVTDLAKEAKASKHNYKLDPLVCDKWAVVTTIFDPTVAIQRQALIPGWCIVVVGDKKGPVNFKIDAPLKNYVFLTAARQEEMASHFPLVGSLPWNHFGRKNVGYLYAILHGAKVVWDFDDDNQLINEHHTFVIPGFSNSTTLNPNEVFPAKEPDAATYDSLVFNPYPLMSSMNPFWPRGFPLDRIKSNSSTHDHPIALVDVAPKAADIGIIQSLANHDPDVDAIYRLTQPLPVDFTAGGPTVLVPRGSYSPYNAQATLTMYSALWSLLLPVTIHGRVTDIWRGYAAQRIGIDFGMRLAFSPPAVEHYRNSHNYLADFESEGPLYTSAMRLVEQINEWHSTAPTVPGRIEDLWILMYEHGYIGLKDVELVQGWLTSLISAGYKFPAITNPTVVNSSHNHRRLRVGSV